MVKNKNKKKKFKGKFKQIKEGFKPISIDLPHGKSFNSSNKNQEFEDIEESDFSEQSIDKFLAENDNLQFFPPASIKPKNFQDNFNNFATNTDVFQLKQDESSEREDSRPVEYNMIKYEDMYITSKKKRDMDDSVVEAVRQEDAINRGNLRNFNLGDWQRGMGNTLDRERSEEVYIPVNKLQYESNLPFEDKKRKR